jgi:hypothetical protein
MIKMKYCHTDVIILFNKKAVLMRLLINLQSLLTNKLYKKLKDKKKISKI